MAFSAVPARGVECVITITRQKPETLFSFIKQIGHMLGMVFTLLELLLCQAARATSVFCYVIANGMDGNHDSFVHAYSAKLRPINWHLHNEQHYMCLFFCAFSASFVDDRFLLLGRQ